MYCWPYHRKVLYGHGPTCHTDSALHGTWLMCRDSRLLRIGTRAHSGERQRTDARSDSVRQLELHLQSGFRVFGMACRAVLHVSPVQRHHRRLVVSQLYMSMYFTFINLFLPFTYRGELIFCTFPSYSDSNILQQRHCADSCKCEHSNA